MSSEKKSVSSEFEAAGDMTMEAAKGFCTAPSRLQIAMDKESFARTPFLVEHFPDKRFFSSVPACVFSGFSAVLVLFLLIAIAFMIA